MAAAELGSEQTLGGTIGVGQIDFVVWRESSSGVHQELRTGRRTAPLGPGIGLGGAEPSSGTDSRPLSVENTNRLAVARESRVVGEPLVVGELSFVRAGHFASRR